MGEIDSTGGMHGQETMSSQQAADSMYRKHAYITLQKGLRDRFPPGAALQAWLEWLDAVYSGDVKRPPPVIARPKEQETSARRRKLLS